MAGVPEKVLNWLYSVLTSEYSDVNRTYHDAAEALSNYPSLTTRTEVYTYENGASALLLLLTGTLPVTFRGQTYGFPVALWVPYAYPREPPIVYVTPSQDMIVRPGQHVSGDGRIYHPYLAQWGKYWDKSTLFDFLAVLQGVFAKEPPVRSKQQQQAQYSAPVQQAPPPVPPTPVEWRRTLHGTPGASPAPGPSNQPPAPPPKPPKPYEQNSPASQSQHNRYAQPPPLPPHPPQQPQRNSYGAPPSWQQQNPGTQQRQSSYDMSPATPVSRPPRAQFQAQGYQPNAYELGSPVSPITPDGQRSASHYSRTALPPQPPGNVPTQQYQGPPGPPQQQYGRPPPAQQQYQQPPPQFYPAQAQHPQYQQQQQPPPQQAPPAPKPPIDLLDDSLEVTLPSQTGNQAPIPVPPVPPNPEKDALLRALSQTLVSQIRQTVSSNTAAVAPLRAQQAALQTAYSRLQAELGELQQLDATLASNEQILKGAMADADRVMEDARRRQAPDVDDVLVAPTVVGGQLYTLAAEERGIEDTLFVLGRALDKGRVSADVFVKQTRSLAREQFLKKALIKKIAKGMALDEYQMR
ncbi:UEV-domain-containing protein [Cucurbitaria berberidis CBS 394.84]|uniref:UEV-domain-containing protein n=1 Tax=Cucurbitaria berberidis CBS 394.84 TaxID=1168544 RepID=A0A9P4GK40_9PLEO|nr:UEV-domain-containing protein [Cucurbitaria berberidis CBS 394.84]KAF1847758.1 UEV-domain-containing protein [Cucurbitaria berberidis CBS 394.84]